MYPIIKYIHIFLAITSVAFFQYRFWRQQQPSKFIKTLPHVIDTCLLLSGVTLAWLVGFSPTNSPWLLYKLLAVVVYIVFGALAMRGKGPAKWLSYAVATLTVVYILWAANMKQVWPLP